MNHSFQTMELSLEISYIFSFKCPYLLRIILLWQLVFIFLIITVGCSKEPSLLDRCVATNSEEVNYYDKFVTFHKEHVRLRDIFISSVKPAEYYGLDIESLSVFTFNAEQNRYYWDRKWSRANHPNCKTCSDAPSWEEPWNNYLKHISDFIN